MLWAGIVRALAEKVEEEFGIFTTRMFRTLNLETTAMPENDENFHRLFLKFFSSLPGEDVVRKTFDFCQNFRVYPLKQWKKETNANITLNEEDQKEEDKFMVVEFEKATDAMEVFEKMKCVEDVTASFAWHVQDEMKLSPATKNDELGIKAVTPMFNDSLQKWLHKIRWNNVAIVLGFVITIIASAIFSVDSFFHNFLSVRYYNIIRI